MKHRGCLLAGLLLVIGGCRFPVREHTDQVVCDLASRPLDASSASSAIELHKPTPQGEEKKGAQTDGPGAGPKKPPRLGERLEIPRELPGADVPPLHVPQIDPAKPAERDEAFNKLYQPLPPLGGTQTTSAATEAKPLTLAELQSLAMGNNPVIRQMAADVQAARGAEIQAGLYPNPTVGYEGDTIGTGPGAGYQGAFVEQTIKTGNKVQLAKAAATVDLINAELALKRAQYDLMARVRASYYAVLVAQETVRITAALARFTEEVFRVRVDLAKGGQAAPYEPFQGRVLAMQARGALVQAQNHYASAWKQMASALGLPGMPPTALVGRVESAVPVFDYEKTLAQTLAAHTDVRGAENAVIKARYLLRSAEITPVPDVNVRVMVQKDYTTPPFHVTPSVSVGIPLPVWDRNQGGIMQAQAALLRAVEESHRVRSDLTGRVAEAFERYQSNRQLLDYYRRQIIPDEVRAYRGVYEQLQLETGKESGRVNFSDITQEQQNLTSALTSYLTALAELWKAVVDLANLTQLEDLGGPGAETCSITLEDLDKLFQLPCTHPCGGNVPPEWKKGDAVWPVSAQDTKSSSSGTSR